MISGLIVLLKLIISSLRNSLNLLGDLYHFFLNLITSFDHSVFYLMYCLEISTAFPIMSSLATVTRASRKATNIKESYKYKGKPMDYK